MLLRSRMVLASVFAASSLLAGVAVSPLRGAPNGPAIRHTAAFEFQVGDVVEVGSESGFQPGKTAVCRVIQTQDSTIRYQLRMLQLPNLHWPAGRDTWSDGSYLRPRTTPYSDDWNPAHYIGTWKVGASTRTNTTTGYDGKETRTITAGGGEGTLTIRADGTYHWVITKSWQVRGRWVKSNDPGAAMVLKKGKMDWDYNVYPHHRDEKGRIVIGFGAVGGGSFHSGNRVGVAPNVPKLVPSRASATRPATANPSSGSPDTAKPNAPATKQPAPPTPPTRTYRVGESVDVFQGVGWKTATILAVETTGYRVTYNDRGYTPDEVAVPLRLRPADSPAVGEVRVGDRVEVLHRFVGDKFYSWPATVVEVSSSGVTVRCDAPKGMDYETHNVYPPDNRMQSNITRILSRKP